MPTLILGVAIGRITVNGTIMSDDSTKKFFVDNEQFKHEFTATTVDTVARVVTTTDGLTVPLSLGSISPCCLAALLAPTHDPAGRPPRCAMLVFLIRSSRYADLSWWPLKRAG